MADTHYEKYLKSIKFEERLEKSEWFSNEEYKELFVSQLREYKKGNVSRDFIKKIAWIFYTESSVQVVFDSELVGLLCEFSDVTESEFDHLVNISLTQLKADLTPKTT